MKIVAIEPLGVEENLLRSIAKQRLKEEHELVIYKDRASSSEELIARGIGAEAIIVANQPLPAEVIASLPSLKMLSVAFTGVDHIPLPACREQGHYRLQLRRILYRRRGGSCLWLAPLLYRRIPACNEAVRKEGTKDGLVGFEVEGKKFGVVGAGAIGMRVAQIAAAFGCEVYAYSRTQKELTGVKFVSLDELLCSCDIISLHTPLNEQTRGLIGKAQLSQMKMNAVLINTARGPSWIARRWPRR